MCLAVATSVTAAAATEEHPYRYASVSIRDLLARIRGTELEKTAAALALDPSTLVLVPSIEQCVLCDGESGALHIASVVPAPGGRDARRRSSLVSRLYVGAEGHEF